MSTKVGDLLVELVVQAAKGNSQAVKAATASFKNVSGEAEKTAKATRRSAKSGADGLASETKLGTGKAAKSFSNLSKAAGIELDKIGPAASTSLSPARKAFGKFVQDSRQTFGKLGTSVGSAFSKVGGTVGGAFRSMQSGAIRATDRMQSAFGSAATNIRSFSGKVSGLGGTFTKSLTMPILGAVGAVGALAGALGFKRLVGIDTARGQFRGLGYDADAVMKQVDVGVTDTALAMADGAALAVGILATGGVEMDKLSEQIKRVANVSAAYNLEGSQAGYLLNNVLTKQKVTWGDLTQMQRNQIPIISQLRDHYGVTGEELEKMVSQGKVSIEDLNTVLDKNAGAAAEEYAKTWAGVTANIRSNLGKIGAAFLEGAFEQAKGGATELLEMLRDPELADGARAAGKAFSDFIEDTVERLKGFKKAWDDLSGDMKTIILTAGGIAVAFGPALSILGLVGRVAAGGAVGLKLFAGALSLIAKHPIVTAITIAVGALIWFFTETETGRALVETAWEMIQQAIEGVTDWWTNTAAPAFADGWEAIKGAASAVSDWWTGTLVPGLAAAWEPIKNAADDFAKWWEAHVNPVFESFGNLVEAVVEKTRYSLEKMGEFFMRVGEDIMWLWDNVLSPVFDWIGERFEAAWGQVKAVWDVIGPPLMEAMSVAWENMKIAVEAVWDYVVLVIENALADAAATFEFFTALIKGDWEGAWNAIMALWDNFLAYTQQAAEIALAALGAIFGNAWEHISGVTSEIWNSITSFLSGVWQAIVGVATIFGNRIGSFFSSLWEGIKGVATIVWNAIVTFITGIPARILSGLSDLGQLGARAAEWFGEFLSAAKDKFTEAVDFARGIPDKILSALGNVGSKLLGAGRSLIGGFVDGIGEGFSRATEAVRNGMERIRNFFPFSPAKEGAFSGSGYTAFSGATMMKDYGEGISKGATLAVRAGQEAQERLAAILGTPTVGSYRWTPNSPLGSQAAAQSPSVASSAPSSAAGEAPIHIGVLHVQMPENAEWEDMQRLIRDVKRSKQEGYMMGTGATSGYSG